MGIAPLGILSQVPSPAQKLAPSVEGRKLPPDSAHFRTTPVTTVGTIEGPSSSRQSPEPRLNDTRSVTANRSARNTQVSPPERRVQNTLVAITRSSTSSPQARTANHLRNYRRSCGLRARDMSSTPTPNSHVEGAGLLRTRRTMLHVRSQGRQISEPLEHLGTEALDHNSHLIQGWRTVNTALSNCDAPKSCLSLLEPDPQSRPTRLDIPDAA
jgi:hypothetical protein